MKSYFLILLILTSCASSTKSCWDRVRDLYDDVDKNNELVLYRGDAGRSREDAIWLIQRSMPVFHQAGKGYSVDRTRRSDSENEYDETNYSGIWSLRDGQKSSVTLVCQDDKHGNYHAYAIVDKQDIKNYLIGE